jgi:hypothetical protein
MVRRIVHMCIVMAALTAVAAPAFADKGGGSSSSNNTTSTAKSGGGSGGSGGPSHTASATIAIATVDGTPMAASTLTAPALKVGDSLTFATTAGSLAGWEYPMVAVSCYQGSDLVFTQLDTPSASFMLGGYSSIWLDLGGSASCHADLDAYGWKNGVESVRTLASVPLGNVAAG